MTLLTLPAVDADQTDAEHFNNVRSAMTGDLLPRNSDGEAEDLAGELGTDTYPFLRANVHVGYVPSGAVIPWYDYNGALDIPQGYMVCNGDQINQTRYNLQHRTDAEDDTDYWSLYVGSSPLEELYTPNLNAKFIKGTTSATQDGTGAITSAGNTSSTINLAHDHGGGGNTDLVGGTQKDSSNASPWISVTSNQHRHSFTVPSNLGTRDITPVSVNVKFLIRIVE